MRSPRPRSGCPVGVALDIIGDKWSLLVVRDLMVRGYRTFKEFQDSGERIATNILSARLRMLARRGIVKAQADPSDGRRSHYRLTEKGIDLAPVLLEVLIWGARHAKTGAPCGFAEYASAHRDQLLAEARRRWEQDDRTPLLPPFARPGFQRAKPRFQRKDKL